MRASIQTETNRIISSLSADISANRAVLASLRGATSIDSPRARVIWPVLFANSDETHLSTTGKPTYAEISVYAGIRMYALAQQGQQADSRHDLRDESIQFFTVLSQLRHRADSQVALDRRVKQLLSSSNVRGTLNSLYSLLRIAKSADKRISFDFGRLAEDLYWFQFGGDKAKQVVLRWGQQYYSGSLQKDN